MTPILITARVLEGARLFFEERGSEGLEGTALIAGKPGGTASRLVIPEQEAARGFGGCWVEVPKSGKLALAAALRPDEVYVARIHSHPGEAYHSGADDENPVLTQQGAISIVVPFYGLGLRRGLDRCAIYVRRGSRWAELPPGPERARFVRQHED